MPFTARSRTTSSRATAAAFALALGVLPLSALAQDADTIDTDYIKAENALPPGDVIAVQQVVFKLNHALDAADYELYGSFFAEDGVFVSGFGNATGPDGVAAAMEASSAFTVNKRHAATNLIVSGEGDRAVVTSYLIVFERTDSISYVGSAVNTDTMEKRDGRWLVVEHDSVLDPATAEATRAAMEGSSN